MGYASGGLGRSSTWECDHRRVLILPTLTSTEIERLAERHPEWFDDGSGLPSPPVVSATLLGRGESYDAWLAVAIAGDELHRREGPRKAVVRMPRRPPAEMPRPIGEEFAALSVPPAGIGPRPIYLHQADAEFDREFMVVEFIDGHVRPPETWTDALLVAHAQQLARLHERTFRGHGDLTVAETDLIPYRRIVEHAQNSMAWWRGAAPHVTETREVAELWNGVRRHLVEAEPAFSRLTEYALLHGDACVPNILVRGGVTRYVDWEWSAIGDPARDLAYLGGDVWTEPWYLPLGPDRIELLVDAYIAASPNRHDRADLLVRRDAWMVFEMFFVSLHFRQQGKVSPYPRAVADLTDRLTDKLL